MVKICGSKIFKGACRAAKWTGIVFLFSGMISCSSSRGAKVPPRDEATLKISAHFNRENYIAVNRAFVYPPLKMSEKGIPQERLSCTTDEQGALHWYAPSAESVGFRKVIESRLRKRGFRIVPFQEILDPQNGYAIMVFNPYYTSVVSRDDSRKVQVVVTRLSGVLLPDDLDLSKKQTRIYQEILARFNSQDAVAAAVKTAFAQSVEQIGENEDWVETVPLLK